MDEHVLPTYRRAEPIFVDGRGAWLYDAEGREYLDFLTGIGVTALGHAHPRLVRALSAQLGAFTHVSNLLRHPYTEELAARLAELSGMEAVFFSNSGSEAVETALKIARKRAGARGVDAHAGFVALKGGFHGRTLGALSVTSREAYRAPFAPLFETTFVEPNDDKALEAALARQPAALILEPVQGEGGVRALTADYLRCARRLCDASGTLLIHDEVQCGAGRTGHFLAAQGAGVTPDVVTLAKPIAAGLPMGVTLVRAELAAALGPGDHGSTFGGGPLACRAALVFLDELVDGGVLGNVRARGHELAEGLDSLCSAHAGVERRGVGLLQGLRVPGGHEALQRALFERGLIAGTCGDEVVRFLPPFVVTSAEVQRALELIDRALTESAVIA